MIPHSTALPEPLPGAGEPPAYTLGNARGTGSAVIVCDHASNRIPRCLGTLGIAAADRTSHIAWDPGAAAVAAHLAALLDSPLLQSGYSRLVIDCNRPLTSPDSIAARSAGVAIPGNRALSGTERRRRITALFEPYHRAIAGVLDDRAAAGRPSLLLSLHSFTAQWNGRRRPWHIGFSYGRDARLASLLRDAFIPEAQAGGLVVGDNQPYDVSDDTDYTLPVHGERRGIPHVLIEIRNDGLAGDADAAEWARRLARAYVRIQPPPAG